MPYKTILYEIDKAIAIITINRPKVLNALNFTVITELKQIFLNIATNDKIKVVILTGTGNKSFVAGADIAAMSHMTPIEARNFSRQLQELTIFMEFQSKPIIAAVNGFALGGGTEISLACDFIYASNTAKFGQPEINLGIIPGAGGTQRLSRLINKNWAKELCLTGDIIDATLAKKIGLVNRIFLIEELMPAAIQTAQKIAAKGLISTQSCKDLINYGFDIPLTHALRLEAEAFGMCFTSPDQQEGMNAFLSKRTPVFKDN